MMITCKLCNETLLAEGMHEHNRKYCRHRRKSNAKSKFPCPKCGKQYETQGKYYNKHVESCRSTLETTTPPKSPGDCNQPNVGRCAKSRCDHCQSRTLCRCPEMVSASRLGSGVRRKRKRRGCRAHSKDRARIRGPDPSRSANGAGPVCKRRFG